MPVHVTNPWLKKNNQCKMMIWCNVCLKKKKRLHISSKCVTVLLKQTLLFFFLSIFLLVVGVEIDSNTTNPYIPQKSLFQWNFSKFFVLYHGHVNFWRSWIWKLLEAKNAHNAISRILEQDWKVLISSTKENNIPNSQHVFKQNKKCISNFQEYFNINQIRLAKTSLSRFF